MLRLYRVLLVEDSKVFSRLVASLLEVSEEYDFELDIVATYKEASEILHVKTYDAVILDLTLPDSEPEHTFNGIAELIPETAIIVSTGSTGNDLALNALRKGAQDYLPKSGINSNIICNSLVFGIERKRLLLKSIEQETVLKRRIVKLTERLLQVETELSKYQEHEVSDHSKPESKDSSVKLTKSDLDTVLVVDDIEINRTITSHMLRKIGLANVDHASNGEEAIQMWENKDYKLIIMDIHMPVMDGITSTAKINELSNDNHPIVIALSASVNSNVIETCMCAGMNQVISKPLTLEKMKKTLSQYVTI